MFSTFVLLHAEAEDLASLKQSVVYKVSIAIRNNLYNWRWAMVIWQLARLEPIAFSRYAKKLFSRFLQRLTWVL